MYKYTILVKSFSICDVIAKYKLQSQVLGTIHTNHKNMLTKTGKYYSRANFKKKLYLYYKKLMMSLQKC